jgi:hypothetical protein
MGGQCQERRCNPPLHNAERGSGKYRGNLKSVVIVLEFAASLVLGKDACAAPKVWLVISLAKRLA